MKELINEFREWDQKWWKYDYEGGVKPISLDIFLGELEKKYKVLTIEEYDKLIKNQIAKPNIQYIKLSKLKNNE